MALPVVNLNGHNFSAVERLIKTLLDRSLALFIIVLTLPLWLFISLLIKLTSPGPVFFLQERVGYKGRIFKMIKFRSMYNSSKKFAGAPHSPQDERITSMGRWLRRTSMDELPQLINVFLGEMSLVGPRPEMPFIVESYEPWQRKRLDVMPGITGLWQIQGRTKEAPIHAHLEFDFYYILNQSLLTDLKILGQTMLAVTKGRGTF